MQRTASRAGTLVLPHTRAHATSRRRRQSTRRMRQSAEVSSKTRRTRLGQHRFEKHSARAQATYHAAASPAWRSGRHGVISRSDLSTDAFLTCRCLWARSKRGSSPSRMSFPASHRPTGGIATLRQFGRRYSAQLSARSTNDERSVIGEKPQSLGVIDMSALPCERLWQLW